MLTIALSTGERPRVPATHTFHVAGDDPLVAQELHLATYHMLWELTHIVLNHRGIAEVRRVSDGGCHDEVCITARTSSSKWS